MEWLFFHCFQIELKFSNVDVFVEEGKRRIAAKNPLSRDENQQQTPPTYGVNSGIQTRATLMGGKRSHHCTIPASPKNTVAN